MADMNRATLPITLSILLLFCVACDDPELATGSDASTADAGAPDAASPDSGGDACPTTPAAAVTTPKIYTPRWAFEPWISKDISTGKDSYDFVNGFIQRDIPVGVLVIDSPWETNYNTFIPNDKRYPKFKQMVADMHAKKVKVVMWVTQMINSKSFDLETGGDTYENPSPNWPVADKCGFMVNGGFAYTWWKGFGGGIDFFNPVALEWWQKQQDHVLDMGIDGWKLDFGEEYIDQKKPIKTAKGDVTHQAYSEEYYRSMWAYGVKKRGAEFLTMVRGYDKSYTFDGRFFARPEHAPVVWAGDNRRDWIGLADALDHMFRSAKKNYVVVGSDVGGYLDFDDTNTAKAVPFSQDNFVRWVAVGGMSPFFQLHGRGNLTPWTVTPKTTETVAIYRYWSHLHHEMVPFWYSLAQEAYANKTSIIFPVGAEKDWPGDYRYTVGQALLVAPILDKTGKRDVPLPAGSRWYDWWKPADAAVAGGTTLKQYDATNQQRIPIFAREGAIIPAEVEADVAGLGTKASKGYLTLLIWPSKTQSSFTLHDKDSSKTTITAVTASGETTVTISKAAAPVILRVRADAAHDSVTLDGKTQTTHQDYKGFQNKSDGWYSDTQSKWTWVKLPKSASKQTVVLKVSGD